MDVVFAWFSLFILFRVISPLISTSILGTYRPGKFTFHCPIIFLLVLLMGFSRQENRSGLPFPSLKVKVKSLSHVRLFATPWTVAYQSLLSVEFSRQEYWSELSLSSPSLVDHILSELSTVIRPSWVTLQGMAHSFIELDKAVVHVISLNSFLPVWFSFCWPSDG